MTLELWEWCREGKGFCPKFPGTLMIDGSHHIWGTGVGVLGHSFSSKQVASPSRPRSLMCTTSTPTSITPTRRCYYCSLHDASFPASQIPVTCGSSIPPAVNTDRGNHFHLRVRIRSRGTVPTLLSRTQLHDEDSSPAAPTLPCR